MPQWLQAQGPRAYVNLTLGMPQDKRAATVRAVTDAQVLALHRDDFNKLLGNLENIRHVWRFEALHKVCRPWALSMGSANAC